MLPSGNETAQGFEPGPCLQEYPLCFIGAFLSGKKTTQGFEPGPCLQEYPLCFIWAFPSGKETTQGFEPGPCLQEYPLCFIGVSPSGKAQGFDPCMRRFESSHPSHILCIRLIERAYSQVAECS